MSDVRNDLTPAQVAQTDANLRLAAQFIREYLDDPDRDDPIPLGASIILLPPGEEEPELRRHNLAMARKLIAEGREVVYWTVGAQPAAKDKVNRKRA